MNYEALMESFFLILTDSVVKSMEWENRQKTREIGYSFLDVVETRRETEWAAQTKPEK